MNDKAYQIVYIVQAPTRPNDKIEKAIQLLRKRDLESLLTCKQLIVELINENRK